MTLPLAWAWAHRDAPDNLVEPEVDPDLVRLDKQQVLDVLDPPARPAGKGGDIAVIVLDTVRADRLGVYGYNRDTTPQLDAWAKGARVYTRMSADGDWTLPSHASLFTGLSSARHGARGIPRDAQGTASPLAADVPTVAEAMQKAGYWTIGIAANRAFLSSAWGLSRGFDLWLCDQLAKDPRAPYLEAARVTAMALEALDHRGDRPVFLFLNYMDAHAPWLPRRGYVREPDAIVRETLPYDEGWEAARTRLMGARERDATTQRSWSEAYDSELRYLDEHLAPLLARLDGFEHVYVLSDHGEFLGEHDLVEHSKDIYEPIVHVPLIVRGEAPGVDDAPIQHHDVARMILANAGIAELPEMEHTADMTVSEQYWSRKRDLVLSFGRRFDRVRRAFRIGDQKLILSSDGKDEAYDLATDPGERSNIRGAPWAEAVRARAKDWISTHPVRDASVTTSEDVEALEALGYVDGR